MGQMKELMKAWWQSGILKEWRMVVWFKGYKEKSGQEAFQWNVFEQGMTGMLGAQPGE